MTKFTSPLSDRVVLLTGVSGDIGATYLSAFTRAGANVVATDLPQAEEAGQRLATEATDVGPGRAVFVGCDIRDGVGVQGAIDTAIEEFGGLHSVVNNADLPHTGW